MTITHLEYRARVGMPPTFRFDQTDPHATARLSGPTGDGPLPIADEDGKRWVVTPDTWWAPGLYTLTFTQGDDETVCSIDVAPHSGVLSIGEIRRLRQLPAAERAALIAAFAPGATEV